MYDTIRALRQGKTIQMEGLTFKMATDASGAEEEIKPGDFYVAERNTGPYLLTAREIVGPGEAKGGHGGWVVPVENVYCFDTPECVKVVCLDL